MNEERKMKLFNDEKMFVTNSIMSQFGYIKNLIDWASEDLYRWADKTRRNKESSCGISEYFQCTGEYLEQSFNNALVLSVYAILEDGLKRISEFYELNIKTNVEIQDFNFYNRNLNEYSRYNKIHRNNKEYKFKKVSSLKKYAVYLERIGVGCTMSEIYNTLENWTLVRNSIIHAGSEIKELWQVEKIKKVVMIDDMLEEISSYSFIIDNGTLKEFIGIVEQYLSSIFNYKIVNIGLQEQESL